MTAARVLVVAGAVGWASACHEPLDTTREKGPRATFGDDLYGVFCDRLGADLFQEDLTGASFQGVCHYDEKGNYADEVDESVLPAPKGDEAKQARRIALAKMNALVRRRRDLVQAFNATFPDVDIDDPSTKKDGDTVNLLDAMMDLGQRVSALYEKDPYAVAAGDPFAEPLAPASTRAMGRLFDSISESEDARVMLSRMWGRRGYRPSNVGLGIVRSSLDYPNLRELTTQAVSLLGPDGKATPQLQALLGVMENKLAYLRPEVSELPELTVDANLAQPNRPRTTIELMREVMLSENDRYSPDPNAPPRYIALRDKRGYVQPAALGNLFADTDGDGRADVDDFGRFLDASGTPLAIDPPFAIPGQAPVGALDELGRPADGLYRYVDTARTPAAGLSSILVPILDSTEYADPEDPEAFMSEYETLMYAMAGAYVLLGPREEAEYDFEKEEVVPAGTKCASCISYQRFRGEDSPLVDAAHAVGQLLADEESDIVLLGMIDLLENHEDKVARLVAAALRIREISLEHDELAAQGMLPPAGLPYENPLWDEAAQVLSVMTDEPRLLSNLIGALADPVVVQPIGGSNHMGETIALFASTRDELDYNHNDVNGPSINLTDGGFSIADPHNAVDWNAPRSGSNRSVLERSLLLIHDTHGAKTCNKNGAVVKAKLLGLTLDWPLTGSYGPCELFEIPDLASFYFGAIVHPTHPKRAVFALKDNALNGIMDFFGFISSPDEMFQESSGLVGMTTHPTPNALNRLVYFGASSDMYPSMPDLDVINQGGTTDEFIYSLMEPTPTSVCPVDGFGLANCQQNDLLRIRTGQDIFTWERRGFYDYLRPVITTFVNVSCSEDVTICDLNDFTGEKMFLRLSDVFYSHYPGPDHGDECTENVDRTDKRYCSGAGLNRYEPIIDKAMRTDIIPALHEFALAMKDVSRITIQRGPLKGQTLTGTQVLEITTRVLFSQTRSTQQGVTDKNGNSTATWTDGTPQNQTTPFNLLTDALHNFDAAFTQVEDGDVRQAQWKRARSQLVDVLLATEGEGANTRFKNRALAPLLVTTLKLFREQLNAHCPDRETGGGCAWARTELSKNLADSISSPMLAGMVDLLEELRKDSNARRALERYLTYLLENAGSGESLQGTLASMVDMMQVMADDGKLCPILNAAAVAMSPHDSPGGAGAADTTIRVLKALSSDEYDKYHVMDHVLRNLVTPIPDDTGALGHAPLEIIIETIAEVNRADPDLGVSEDGGPGGGQPLDPDDYQLILGVVRDFMLDKTRGLEQIYSIVQRRRRR